VKTNHFSNQQCADRYEQIQKGPGASIPISRGWGTVCTRWKI